MSDDSTFLIRPAVIADIADLRALIEHSVRHLGRSAYSAAQIEGALGHALGLDTQLIEDQTYFISELTDGSHTIAGCGGWSYRKTLFGSDRLENREMSLLDPAVDAAKIRAIFVHPDFARRGLGSLILKHCEEAAGRAGFRSFEMGSTLTGVPLYRLHGYEARERVDIALQNGEILGVLRMVKNP